MSEQKMNCQKEDNSNVDKQDGMSRREALKKSAVTLGACYLAPATMDLLLADRATAASVDPGPDPSCPTLTITNNSQQDIEITWIPCGQSAERVSLVQAGGSLNGRLNPTDIDVGLRQLPVSLPPYPCNGSAERAALGSTNGWDSVAWGSAPGQCPAGTANRPLSTAMVLTITFIDE